MGGSLATTSDKSAIQIACFSSIISPERRVWARPKDGIALTVIHVSGRRIMHRRVTERSALPQHEVAKLAPQRRVALASNASNTGCKVPVVVLMTVNTSDVAVCCSEKFSEIVSALAQLVE